MLKPLIENLRVMTQIENETPKPELTPAEAMMLGYMKTRMSDKQIKLRMRIDHNQALSISMALRNKLGVKLGETMRDAAKRLGL